MSGGFRGWEGNGLPVENASSGDKDAADAYALQQGLQFTQEQPQQQQQMPLGGYMRPPAYAAVGAQATIAGRIISLRHQEESRTDDVDAICKLLSAMSLQPERTVGAAPPAAAAAVPPAAHPPSAVPVPAAPHAAAAAAKQQSMNPAIQAPVQQVIAAQAPHWSNKVRATRPMGI